MPSIRLGRTRWRSTSRSASTRPASRTWASCSTCAPRMLYSPPSLHSRALSPCMPLVRCRRPTPSRLPAHTSLRIVRLAFDSAARVGVQPAAELRHVQRHEHVPDVPGALLPVPCSDLCNRALSPARCDRTSSRTVCSPCDSAASKLPIQRQQAAHPLRVGGHLGFRLLLLLWLPSIMGKLAFGKLLAELSSHRGACDWVESALGRICGDYSLDPSPQFACGGNLRRREGRGGEETASGGATTEQGLRCLTSADQHVGVGVGTVMLRRSAAAAMVRAKGARTAPNATAARGMGRGGHISW